MLVLQQEPSSWPRWTSALALCLLLPFASHAADPKRNLAISKTTPAATEQRVALVIGNANYKSAPLRNPANDAKAIADKLQALGFKVTLKLDQDQKSMADAIRTFGNQLKAGGAGLFYYAGHGMQVKGRNFLIPVDADIQNEDEVLYRSIDANEVLSKMETAQNRLNLMILDACRNNPFSRKFRSSSQGLAQMDAPSGTLVAFATAPGSVASDGTGKNGLYTQHLLASLGQPGLPVEQLFKRVRVGVMKDTRNAQVPWESSSLVGDFYFKPGTATSTTTDPTAIELAYWESIKDSTNADDYKAYLKKYPNGQFADLAKHRVLNPQKPASTAVASIVPDSLIDDEGVEFKINSAIAEDTLLKDVHINVTSLNGVVLLTGEAPTEAQRAKILEHARAVPRVRRIVNEIHISPPTAYSARSSDSWLTTKVHSKLTGDDKLGSLQIKVVTENGVVYLMGLTKKAEGNRAAEIVRRVDGVQMVVKLFEYTD